MGGKRHGAIAPTRWAEDQLDRDRRAAIALFRRERLEEPIEDYGEFFDAIQGAIEDFLEATTDLSRLDEEALAILIDPDLRTVFRYLAGPPISEDDLSTLVDAPSLATATLRNDPDLVQRLVAVVRDALDRRRFPWVFEGREPDERERTAATIATAALVATRRTETKRRNQGKAAQEEAAWAALLELGFAEVKLANAEAATIAHAPKPGEFSREASLAGRKADLIVGLWDHRVMPIECKVSNSSVNSIKRLNNDAAAKAEGWKADLGQRQVVPTAVLSGVFGLNSLLDAQTRGLTLYWAHRLSDLTDWIAGTAA